MAPIRHPAPSGELRLEWPGQCWVWAASYDGWSVAFENEAWAAGFRDRGIAKEPPGAWYATRTRGSKPPWPDHVAGVGKMVMQRDPGDENPEIEADGFVTVWPGPSAGFTQQGARP